MTMINKEVLKYIALAITLSLGLFSCTTIKIKTSQNIALPFSAPIAAGPLANYSDTPLANKQVETILASVLYAEGFVNTIIFPKKQACEKLLYCPGDMPSREDQLLWARKNNIAYIVSGSVNEWRYKVGLDGEPVAGVTLHIIDTRNGKVLWTGLGSMIGNSRQGLEVVGQQMIQQIASHIIPTTPKGTYPGK